MENAGAPMDGGCDVQEGEHGKVFETSLGLGMNTLLLFLFLFLTSCFFPAIHSNRGRFPFLSLFHFASVLAIFFLPLLNLLFGRSRIVMSAPWTVISASDFPCRYLLYCTLPPRPFQITIPASVIAQTDVIPQCCV